MWQKINHTLTGITDTVMTPFASLGDFWAILFLSVLTSLVVLVVYKYLSSPAKIKGAKNGIKSNILAIRLYKDFWRVILSSFIKSLFHTLKYFALNFGPVIIILPLLIPLFMQMDVRYGVRPYRVGEPFVLKAKFNANLENLNIELLDDPHFKPAMRPVFIKAKNEVNWKLITTQPGQAQIGIRVNERVYNKSLHIGDWHKALSKKKLNHSSLEHFIYPAEDLLDTDGEITSIYLKYPGKLVTFLGTHIHWIIHYLVLVLIIVLALRKRFGVEF